MDHMPQPVLFQATPQRLRVDTYELDLTLHLIQVLT